MNIRENQKGALNVLLIPLILSMIFFFAAAGFSVWAYMSRQDYKDNSDQKAAQAADVAARRVASDKDNEFIEKEKYPLQEYRGPADLGSISFSYPKTWSGYITNDDSESSFVFHPNVVISGEGQVYALRVVVDSQRYSESVEEFDSAIEEGKAKASAYALKKVPKVVGLRINGEFEEGKNGSVIILPLRDKTIKIFTDGQDYIKDLNNIILPGFSFSP